VTATAPAPERLLEAASRLMHERGYEAVGVAELCQQAGIKRGSFYFHFESKQALALAMLDRSWERTAATLFAASIDDEALGPIEALSRHGNLLADHLAALQRDRGVVPGCRFGNFAVELSTSDDVIRARVAAILDDMTARVARAVRRGIERGEVPADLDVDRAAARIVAHLEGLMVLAKAHRDPDALRELGPAAAVLLADGR
jgi:TetR/AcrR family transcriptional regulator, transcriptional repressor for nem operon